MEHELKIWPRWFKLLSEGVMTYQIRRNDRYYRAGEKLKLHEYVPYNDAYTGSYAVVLVTHVLHLRDMRMLGGWRWRLAQLLMPDVVVLSVEVKDAFLRDELLHGRSSEGLGEK